MNRYRQLNRFAARHADLAAVLLTLAGLAHRLHAAEKTFLTPEEAFQVLLAVSRGVDALVRNSFVYTHPPLCLLTYRVVQTVHNSDLAMRLPFVLAGGALPLVLYFWLKRLRGTAAAWIVLFVFLMAPNLFFLGWQARGYIQALLGMAVALYGLERARERRAVRWLALSFLGLYAALLAEYMSLFFCGAAGVLGLLRLSPGDTRWRLRGAWAAGQLGALGLIAWLESLRARIKPTADILGHEPARSYLPGQYPAPGENLPEFAWGNTAGVFHYVFSSEVAAAVAMTAFAAGIVLLWTGRWGSGGRDRPLAVFLVVPFLLALGAAWLGVFPYGHSRHSVHLSISIVTGAAAGLEPLFRRRMGLLAVAFAVLTPAWYFHGPTDPTAVPRPHILKRPFLEALNYLRESAPPGAVILTEEESRHVLSYYLDPDTPWPRGVGRREERVGGYTLYTPRWMFRDFTDIREDLAALRTRYSVPANQPVWGFDSGFICAARLQLLREPGLRDELVSSRDFGLGSLVFLMPPGFERPAGAVNGTAGGRGPR